jgi:tetraacyldisaccharide 4'-kinase
MSDSFDTYTHGVMSGRDRSIGAHALRAVTRVAEPFYAGAMRLRNALYDHGLFKTHRLPRPVISVGNLTTGGTGKTPIVCWLASELIKAGHRPAVLLRGYKASRAGISDEAVLIRQIVGADVTVIANRDRVAGANTAIAQRPEIDLFILDDAFQHRRVERDFDLVLIDSTSPFGFDHVLPRGMLREPLRGLKRADAVLITRADHLKKERLIGINDILRKHTPDAPILQTSFALDDSELQGKKKVFVFCGIGNPRTFLEQVAETGASVVGHRFFGDHHPYEPADVAALQDAARATGADLLVTTQKDWVKLANIQSESGIPIVAVGQTLRISEEDSQRLLSWAKSVIVPSAPAEPSAPPASDSEAR